MLLATNIIIKENICDEYSDIDPVCILSDPQFLNPITRVTKIFIKKNNVVVAVATNSF